MKREKDVSCLYAALSNPNLSKQNEHIHAPGSNRLTGTIPAEFGNLYFLERLSLGNNKLEGTIPALLKNAESLTELNLCK